jgi:hypothetical protein
MPAPALHRTQDGVPQVQVQRPYRVTLALTTYLSTPPKRYL